MRRNASNVVEAQLFTQNIFGSYEPAIGALLLVMVANSVPWLAGRVMPQRWATPLDGGIVLWDGGRLFGDHKTWRGVLAGSLATGVAAALWGFGFLFGVGFGALSLLGDALSSSVKRRLRLRPGAEVPVIDQLPEALLPLFAFAPVLHLNWRTCIWVSLVFMLLDIAFTHWRHPHRS